MTKEERERRAKEAGVEVHQVCGACGTASKLVEAGGLWFCPNPRCQGCAGGAVRHLLACKDCQTVEEGQTIHVDSVCSVFERDHAPLRAEVKP